MATVEHCIYAFEALAAKLERRETLDLKDIQESWKEYIASETDSYFAGSSDGTAGKPTKPQPAALQRLASGTSTPSTSSTSTSTSTLSLSADTPATSVSSLPTDDETPLITESPLFVTWNVVSDGEHALRGCIGTFEDQDLDEGIASYALTSALHDSRFSPVRLAELPTLSVSVTLLTDFEDCADSMDWTLGVHGLRISFVYHGRRHGATYLPDVATEQGWTKEETLMSLMRKAGWMGRRDRWRDVELDCVRYQGKKASLEYADFKRWRDWADKNQVGA